MFRPITAIAALLALTACVTASPDETNGPPPPAAEGAANGQGAIAIFPMLDEDAGPDKNVFFSPLSVDYAFSIVRLGARGETADELASILPAPLPPEAYAHNAQGVELRLASRLWVDKQFKPATAFLEQAQAEYLAGAERIDKTKPAQSAELINDWASKATNGLIPSVVGEKEIAAMLAMIITNAIYFDGDWALKFGGWNMEPFLHGDGSDKPFKLMFKRDELATVDRGDWRAIRLPYSHPRYAMDIIMPKDREVMVSAPSLGMIADFGVRLDAAKPKLVDMKLPQFEIETDFDLVEPLKAMGLQRPFDPVLADLSGMVEGGGRGLVVGGAKQLARLQIFDTGTKAAAVTVISIIITSAGRPDTRKAIEFTVDRPFIVALRDLDNDAVLFLGRIAQPKAFEPEESEDSF